MQTAELCFCVCALKVHTALCWVHTDGVWRSDLCTPPALAYSLYSLEWMRINKGLLEAEYL